MVRKRMRALHITLPTSGSQKVSQKVHIWNISPGNKSAAHFAKQFVSLIQLIEIL